MPVVVKADGLAAGKGVFVCSTRARSHRRHRPHRPATEFGDAGNQIVIEERLDGQEASVLAITDGRTIVTLPPAQDHKRAYDGDTGPNTGGMGAYCPAPLVDDETLRIDRGASPRAHRARHEAVAAAVPGRALCRADDDQPGPEGAGVQRPLRRSRMPAAADAAARRDLVDLLEATVDGQLDEIEPLEWDPRPAVCVVMASEGYPGNYEQGRADPRAGRSREAARRESLSRRHGNWSTARSSPTAAACWASPPSATRSPPPSCKPTPPSKCIRWNGAWCRKDISDKALHLPKPEARKK